METLSALLTSPLDAVSGLVETVLPGTPSAAGATASGSSEPNPTFTEDTLRMILHNMFAGDSRLQGQMLSKYWAPDATYSLNEGALSLHDRDSLAQLLRGLQLLATVEPEVLEITSVMDRAVILLNLNLSYKALPLTWPRSMRVQVPATLTLTFGPDSSVLSSTDYVITAFKQEMALPDLMFWNPAWNWFNARLWGPVSGRVLTKLVQLEDPVVGRFQRYVSGGAGYAQAAIWVVQDLANGVRSSSSPIAVAPDTAAVGTSSSASPAAAAAAGATQPSVPPPPSAELLAAAAPDTPPGRGTGQSESQPEAVAGEEEGAGAGELAVLGVKPLASAVTAAAPGGAAVGAETESLLMAAEQPVA